MQQNEMKLEFDSHSCNESFARVTVAAFMTQLNPTLEEVADVKTAVSEAVTNAIIHAYKNESVVKSRFVKSEDTAEEAGRIWITCHIRDNLLEVEVRDTGCGIADVKRAMEPFFSTAEENDHSGLGFAFMEAFMDTLEVESAPGEGTCVRMTRRIGGGRHSESICGKTDAFDMLQPEQDGMPPKSQYDGNDAGNILLSDGR